MGFACVGETPRAFCPDDPILVVPRPPAYGVVLHTAEPHVPMIVVMGNLRVQIFDRILIIEDDGLASCLRNHAVLLNQAGLKVLNFLLISRFLMRFFGALKGLASVFE